MSAKKHFMVIDVELCEDCGSCYLACKDEFFDNAFPGYSARQPRLNHKWLTHPRKERGHGSLMEVTFRPHLCMQCEAAPCVAGAKDKAVSRRADGIVLIDPVKARGEEAVVGSCPYRAIVWNEEEKLPQKCTLCAHLLDEGWKTTRCAQVCPTGALRLEYLTDAQRAELVAKENLLAYRPDFNTAPLTLYKNLYRFTAAFIAGSVARVHREVVDCVEGARVVLKRGDEVLATTLTDNYGDFKCDGLKEDSGLYTLVISLEDIPEKIIQVRLGKSVYLEDIVFTC